MTKKIPVIFHNLRGYDSHLIIKEISKFDVKVSVIPNGLEKYMAFTINTILVFIDSMQFLNSSLDSLVKNLSANDFKYLSEEFSGEFLKLVKENDHDLYLKTDVLLLADVFEKFINTCLDYYGLDPCHYFSSPGLCWDAMLKMTHIKLDLISDIDALIY